ncbi:hypothetical protein PanWU01x14_146290 [Parasponia andersonii]|uniref:Uncharacterized protein n=1 Tax=Parasponia andersonii TaxID=3476 RepID=A0A2P5CJN6_PARAD|nr:hypothetical protein PanWU01x14_146290 [Parasponia andersonii]
MERKIFHKFTQLTSHEAFRESRLIQSGDESNEALKLSMLEDKRDVEPSHPDGNSRVYPHASCKYLPALLVGTMFSRVSRLPKTTSPKHLHE